ncbi:MAG: hypothetical protein EOO13_11145 [Chitinophagaceae bacterium]|nr:MAG: hypothetical protein EOO13_11145 [Chitinophagaceae bacterium]
MKRILLCVLTGLSVGSLYAQQNVGIGTTTPAASAQLDINSTTKGLLMPRLTSAQRTAIVSPANGLQVYDINTNSFWFYKSNIWVELTGGAAAAGWGLNGNIGTTAAHFIGTIDDIPLDIRQGNSTMAKLFSGNAFIGTGAGSNFVVGAGYDNILLGRFAGNGIKAGSDNIFIGNQSFETSKDTLNNAIGIGPVTVNESNSIKIGAYFQKTGIGQGISESPAHVLTIGKRINGIHQGALKISGSTFHTEFNKDNQENVIINGGRLLGRTFLNCENSGDVIIGANSTSRVGIGSNFTHPNTRVSIQTAAEYANAFILENSTGTVQFNAFLGGPNNGNTVSLGTPGNMPIAMYTNSANRFFISGNGNIGIGTDNPTYKLSVNGNVRSKEVVVEAGWADYVFDKNYELRPLDNVEKFIQENNHLPGIPSAKEIQQHGLHVGELQTKMMEKIEELTLYIIQLKKEMDALKKDQKNEN